MTLRCSLAFLAALGLGCAQSSEFEVASTKPNNGADQRSFIGSAPSGRFNAENMTARAVIRSAYSVKDFQIMGGPAWMYNDRFDITAKGNAVTGVDGIQAMVQSLLADRYKLAFHRETKEMPIYEPVAAKGGLKIAAPKEGSCVVVDPKNPPNPPRPGEPPPRFCGTVRMGRGLLEAYGINMDRFLSVLSDTVGRRVIDKTAFAGTFDVHLEYTPDEVAAGGTSSDSQAPSIFTALQEQLGLRLDNSKGPVEVLVIDHLEKPSEN
jgi:uncharacterized protein (TIGR03435 family)